ncbi:MULTISPECIES: FMN-binding negative transcriptional regulator [unclassified Methylophilus]|uniref:FMN-binding negative transcriptional regulator n=1 Tax=unclassified Methylophilus TaxID=2630143 RepID=UPI0006FF8A7A|nr:MULTISPECIES: FMN-binding negative transcriptional regulator [unclassified Methylophilus]KQT43585.1 transcriptional regulator [Methylophilus sp. Leaf416]KQT59070.1 transcriptional regulator [Methylophilus sp. Leaf459]
MYVPQHFSEPNIDALHALMRAYPLSTLVLMSEDGLNANHIPLYLDTANGKHGTLSGHIARANPLWKDLAANHQVLAIFHGPDAYVTPSWYASKAKTGMVVPTWNYVAVHAHGRAKMIENKEWLRTHLSLLTTDQEAKFEHPWLIEDAPAGFIDKLILELVGIEIEIIQLTGKWKASQNQSVENQLGVIQGLRESASLEQCEMAAIIEKSITSH